MRTAFALVLAAACFAAAPASAQKVDMGTITCDAFLKAGTEFHGQVLMWLTGYYSDEDADAVIDFDLMKTQGEKLGRYCAEHPTVGLMTAAEKVMQ